LKKRIQTDIGIHEVRHGRVFNLIIENKLTAWETNQLMRIDKDRFGEYSGHEGKPIEAAAPDSLAILERCPAFLMYEENLEAVNRDLTRYGKVKNIVVRRSDITFRFENKVRLAGR
jgi:hypothetical protein